MSRIFISYSRHDEKFARKLTRSLVEMGADVWLDVLAIPAGVNWSEAIQDGLDKSTLMLLIISPDAMASHNVGEEWQFYRDQDKPIIPILYKNARMHYQLNRLQWINFQLLPFDVALRELYEALQRHEFLLSPPPVIPTSPTESAESRESMTPGSIAIVDPADIAALVGESERDDSPPESVVEPPTEPHVPGLVDPHTRPTEKVPPWPDLSGIRTRILKGENMGEYRLITSLAQGSMATIDLARSERFARTVAIKRLHPPLAADPRFASNFRKFYNINAQFNHPSILPVYDYGVVEQENLPFIVMRYLDGGNFTDLIDHGALPLPQVLKIIEPVASALDYARARGVLHGNLKPSHILLDKQENAYLADLGHHALFYRDRRLDTNLVYASPEHVMDRPLDARSDIYTLGLIVFEALTGSYPYLADTPTELQQMQLTEPLPPLRLYRPDLPAGVDTVLLTATQKDPEERYLSASAMISDLRESLALT
jgi:hypothetical protein